MRFAAACCIYGALALCAGGCAVERAQPQPSQLAPGVWGVLELPDDTGPHPGVVLLHGSMGWRPELVELASTFAEYGFVALTIDYYAETDRTPMGSIGKLEAWPGYQAAVRNAVAYLQSLPAVSGEPVGLVGFSRGAFLAVSVASSLPGVAAVVAYYGGGGGGPASLEQDVQGLPPVLILHGDDDTVVPVSFAYRLRDAVVAAGGEAKLHVYAGAGHSFNAPFLATYSAEASEDSYRQTIEFLSRRLVSGQAESVTQSIASRIVPPRGYERVAVAPGSFGAWLREFPVRPGRPPVFLYNGDEKSNQAAHFAVLDMDVGDRDLQQCADAVIRLRAEYLYQGPCKDEIQFNFTSGDVARWTDWRGGLRPVVSDNRVTWRQTAAADSGYANFRAYLEMVFMYAGSASLERELIAVTEPATMEIGDVFIQGGFPGHAVLVVDVAENGAGELAFLLAQSYMPAQDIHVLRSSSDIDPWYRVTSAGDLPTPEWDFRFDDLRRFPYTTCEADADGTDLFRR